MRFIFTYIPIILLISGIVSAYGSANNNNVQTQAKKAHQSSHDGSKSHARVVHVKTNQGFHYSITYGKSACYSLPKPCVSITNMGPFYGPEAADYSFRIENECLYPAGNRYNLNTQEYNRVNSLDAHEFIRFCAQRKNGTDDCFVSYLHSIIGNGVSYDKSKYTGAVSWAFIGVHRSDGNATEPACARSFLSQWTPTYGGNDVKMWHR